MKIRRLNLNTIDLKVKISVVTSAMSVILSDTQIEVLESIIKHYRSTGVDLSGETGKHIRESLNNINDSSFRVTVSRLRRLKVIYTPTGVSRSVILLHPLLVDLDLHDGILIVFEKKEAGD